MIDEVVSLGLAIDNSDVADANTDHLANWRPDCTAVSFLS